MRYLKKITISINAELLEKLEEEAEKEKRKLSEYIRLLLQDYKKTKGAMHFDK